MDPQQAAEAGSVSGTVIAAMFVLVGAVITGALTFLASRRTTDDSRAIGLINAGQVSLEAALERATAEILAGDQKRERESAEHAIQIAALRSELAAVRLELASVHAELSKALELHAECERQRALAASVSLRDQKKAGQ